MKYINEKLYKYPRTRHIEGSNEQIGDDLQKIPFSSLKNKNLVIEEKMDGSQSAISFSSNGDLLLQSRGHFLSGGYREKHFNLLKQLSYSHVDQLSKLLFDRYIMYGEWLFAKHSIFYNSLTSYFMEFDVFDKVNNVFLSTSERKNFFSYFPEIKNVFPSVLVLYEGKVSSYEDLVSLVGDSYFCNKDSLNEDFYFSLLENKNVTLEKEEKQTDLSGLMEGLYIKVEENGVVKERYKWVRKSFTQTVINSDSHWHSRPIIKNKIMEL